METGTKRYSQEEINYLKNNYDSLSVKEIAEHLKRPVKGISMHMSIHKQLERISYDLIKTASSNLIILLANTIYKRESEPKARFKSLVRGNA